MDIRRLTDSYAVSPQISVSDVALLQHAGFVSVICNRPDAEIAAEQNAAAIGAEVVSRGMVFVDNPITHGGMGPEQVACQAEAIATSKGPTLAYCASGTRSTIIWMLGAAPIVDPDTLLSAARSQGYDLDMMRPQLAALHKE